jgi:putative transposase
MAIRRAAYAVYDTKYHLVWTRKYRKRIKRSDIRERVGEIFLEISQHHGFEIQEMRVAPDHVHVFLNFCAKIFDCASGRDAEEYLGNRSVRGISGSEEAVVGGEFWEDGYFVRTVGVRSRRT